MGNRKLRVFRLLSYDLMLETAEFLKNIHQFNDLSLPIQNGATLKIYLPHATETALITSYRPGFFATRGTP